MGRRSQQRIQDILDAADELAGVLHGMDQEGFRADRPTQRVAERLLEVAGEAATHVDDDVAAAIAVDWAGLRSIRIRLAHAYHRVDPDHLWLAASVALPDVAAGLRRAATA